MANLFSLVFARIAEQIARRRPDIPILVVESRGRTSWLQQVPLDLSWATNLNVMENTPDPRDFYKVTKILLVPSLWHESFGLVAAEAMANGIPVLASDRGALPEVIRDGGFLYHVGAQHQPEEGRIPAVEEIEPWVRMVLRLWDDADLYRASSEKARCQAAKWSLPARAPHHVRLFSAFGHA